MAKKRAERVKEKLAKHRASLQANKKDRPKRVKGKPIVKEKQTALQINNEKLRKMAEDRIAEIEEKQRNREENEKRFAEIKDEQAQIAKEIDASND